MTADTGGGRDQPLVGYRTNEEWQNLLAQIASMIEDLERLEDAELHRKVFAALQAIDAVHREALHRLVRLFKEGVLEQVVTDPAIHTLMGMYDLLPRRTDAAVLDFLTPEERASGPRVVASAAPSQPVESEAVDLVHGSSFPHWTPVPLARPLADGDGQVIMTEDGPIVVARVEGDAHAVDAFCPTHEQIMYGGVLRHFSWICPLGPGCIYDVRNGARLGGGKALGAHPVRLTENDRLLVGFGIPHEPKLPAF